MSGAREVEPVRSEYLWNPRSATKPTFSCRHTNPARTPEASPLGVKPRAWFGAGFRMMIVPLASTVFMPEARPYTSNGETDCAHERVVMHATIERKNITRCTPYKYPSERTAGGGEVTLSQVPHSGLGMR